MRPTRFVAFLLLTSFALGACGQLPQGVATPSIDAMGTLVAGTLSALTPVSHEAAVPTSEPPAAPTAAPPEPSVLRVAYISAGDVWLVQGDSPPTRLTVTGNAEQAWISSDGQKIAFTRRPVVDGPVEVRVVNSDGSGAATVVGSDQWNALYPLDGFLFNDLSMMDFIPGTHRLMLNTRGIPEGPGVAKRDDLLTVDVEGGSLTTLLPPGSGGDFLLSPDGQKLALTRPTKVSILRVDGSVIRADAITFASVITYSEYAWYPVGVWAADSSAVGFVIPSADPLAPTPSGTVWRIPADGGPAASLATIPGQFFFFQRPQTSLSPDLGQVAFMRDTTTPNVRNLFVAHSDGSGEAIYATGQLWWDGWSQDSAHFAFRLDDPMNLRLGVIGSPAAALATGTGLRWVDGTTYLYLTGGSGSWSLMRGTVGAPAVALASATGQVVSFDFSY